MSVGVGCPSTFDTGGGVTGGENQVKADAYASWWEIPFRANRKKIIQGKGEIRDEVRRRRKEGACQRKRAMLGISPVGEPKAFRVGNGI